MNVSGLLETGGVQTMHVFCFFMKVGNSKSLGLMETGGV